MSAFPVIDSTLSPTHLAAWLIETYNFSPLTTCRLFRTNMNHTYIVTETNTRYILRIYSYNRRTATEITEELHLLSLLKKSGISVSFPIEDVNHNCIQKIEAPEGLRYAVLFSFGEGGKIRNLSQELCYKIGALLAEMHKITLSRSLNRTKYTTNTLVTKAYQQVKPYFSESLEEMKFILSSAERLQTVFEHSGINIRQGIVHLDIWYDNMSITEAGKITLFDFDNCGNGWLVLDIGYFCMQLFHTQPDKKEYEQKLQSFLNGYRSITSFPEQEQRMIPYAGLAIWIYYLGVQAERFDNFSNIFFTENYVKMYIGKVKEWLSYHQINLQTTVIG